VEARALEIADHERRLADTEFEGYCDLYARLARAIADDEDLLGRLAALPNPAKVIPILLFAAVHDLVLQRPDLEVARWYDDPTSPGDPWPPFRALVLGRFDELAGTMARRVIQTNEVGRSAPLLAALTEVHRSLERPLWLVEIGASAGLNLLLDRFGYTFPPADEVPIGDPASPVQLRCEVRGTTTPPIDSPADLGIAGRIGIDPRPVDPTDRDDRRWLAACLWPGITDRAAHLHAALDLARVDPPEVRAGTALDLLDGVLDEVPDHAVPCVLSTWVMAYLSKDERRALHDLLARRGRERPIAAVTGEYQGIVPWIPLMGPGDGPRSTVLGITCWVGGQGSSRAAARIHPHGRWIEWWR
jgi:hypothetical protein